MKKFTFEIKSWICRAALLTVVTLGVAACADPYDDTELRNEIEQIKGDIAELKASLESEIESLKELLAGKITVVSVERRTDGSTVVTLSDESSFTIYPKGAEVPSDLVTVVRGEDGVLYWAMYNSKGEAELIMVDGEAVPVTTDSPEIRVNDDRSIEISFDGGESWIVTGYEESAADSLIADVEVVYSEWQVDGDGNPLALYCLLTLTDGTEIKVGMNSLLVLDYDSIYVAAGSKGELKAMAEDAADYMITLPKGWSCDVEHDTKAGSFTMLFGAPTSDKIKSGEGVGEGVAKLIVVFNNGKSAIASISVSTTPVYVSYIMDEITVTVGGGISSLVCGLDEATSFTAAAAAANANKYLADNTSKAAYGITFDKKTSVTIKATDLRSDLSLDKEYVFWYAIPQTKDGVTSVASDAIAVEDYKYLVPTFKVKEVSLFDAEIEFEVKGSNGYLVGYAPRATFSANNCLNMYRDNKESGITLKQDVTYSGSFLEFFGSANSALESGTAYTAWYLECGGLDDVTVNNLRTWNFTTADFTTGGDLKVTTSEEEIGYVDIAVKLNTEGHIYLYYTFLESYEVSGYPTDDDKLELLRSEGTAVRTTDAVKAQYSDGEIGSKITLLAVAVDKDGKFGEILAKEYTTKKIEYNNALTLAVANPEAPTIVDTRVPVTCEGAESYLYICTPVSGDDWKKLYGGTAKKAGEYMIVHPNGKGVYSTAEDMNALVDGKIVVKGLTEVDHVMVVIAQDADGKFSAAQAIYFKPTMDLGNIVRRDDANWSVGKPAVILRDTFDHVFFNISWYVAPVEGYVAYTMAGNPGYLKETKGVETVEQLMSYIITDCSIESDINTDHGKKCEYSAEGYWLSWENADGSLHEEHDLPGVYNSFFYGDKGITMIYTIWVDADGNFHEPMVFDPTENIEVADWTWE